MNTIGDRIKELRKSLKLTQAEFGEKICVGGAAISAYEKAERSVSDQTIKLICSEFNVSRSWLVEGTGEMLSSSRFDLVDKLANTFELSETEQAVIRAYLAVPKDKRQIFIDSFCAKVDELSNKVSAEKIESVMRLPLADFALSAGNGLIPFDSTYEYITVRADYPKATMTFTVRGDSMGPAYRDGDIVAIQHMPQIEIGEIGAFYNSGKQFIKQLLLTESGYVLHSLNPKYADIKIEEDNRCYGKVLGTVEIVEFDSSAF